MRRPLPHVSPQAKTALSAIAFVCLLIVAGGMVSSPVRAWTAYLIGAFYFLSIALGALVLLALLYVSKAGWGVVVKRVAEGLASYLPWGAASLLAILAGVHTLYSWAGEHGQHDPVLLAKASYLNVPAFAIRMVILLGLWLLFAGALRRLSLEQDKDGAVLRTKRAVAVSAGFLIVFALSFSVASFDWLMSLGPHWQSTIFGWYNLAGVFVSGLAAVLIFSIWLRRARMLPELGTSHVHDLSKLLFGMTTFWAYLWVSQYLLIWYANMPEETAYYMSRFDGGYRFLFWLVPVVGWLAPFLLLLPRAAKRSESHVLRVCTVVLVGRFLDLYVMVAPSTTPEHAGIGIFDVAAFVGFASLFVLVVLRGMRSAPLIAKGDPYLVESLHHHSS